MTEVQLHNWYEKAKKQQESHEKEHQKRPPAARQPAFGLLLGKDHRLPRGDQQPVAIEAFLLDLGFQFLLEICIDTSLSMISSTGPPAMLPMSGERSFKNHSMSDTLLE